MPRLQKARIPATRGGIILYSNADEDALSSTRPLPLRLDSQRFKNNQTKVVRRDMPTEAGDPLQIREWVWQNGTAGAGYSIETPESYQGGAIEYGEFVWLRTLGKAQAAGRLREFTPLPAGIAALTSGQFTAAAVYGDDLYLTTLKRYILQVPDAGYGGVLSERDTGGLTVGAAVFDGKLYIGDASGGIQELDGSTWTEGGAGTERAWLETVYWTLGDQLATGGAAAGAGRGAWRLGGTNALGTGFYHVSGDPKDPADWSALTEVGTGGTAFPIQRTAASNRVIWFGTGLGVLAIDQLGYSPNLTKWVELIASQNNCSAICFWNGLIWFVSESGLAAFAPDGSRIDIPTMPQFGGRNGTTPIYARPLAIAPSTDGLYAGYYDAAGPTSYIGCLVVDPDGSYRWSMAEAVIDNQIVTFLQQVVDSDGNPGLFIGAVNAVEDAGLPAGAFRLYRQDLPRNGDPEAEFIHNPDGPFEAASDWSFRLPRFDGGRAVPKAFLRVEAELDRIGDTWPDNTVTISTALDGGAYVVMGTATSSPYWSGRPATGRVKATSAQVKVDVHNDPAAPVIVRTVGLKYSLRPRSIGYVTYPILIGGGRSGQDPAIVIARLRNELNGDEIVWTNHLGQICEGMVASLDNEESTLESGRWVVRCDLTMSITRVQSRWDVSIFDVDPWG